MYYEDLSPMSWLSGVLIRIGQNNDNFDSTQRNSIETAYHSENIFMDKEENRQDNLFDKNETQKIFDPKTDRLDTFMEEDMDFLTPVREKYYSGYNYYAYGQQSTPSVSKFDNFSMSQPILESQFRFVSSMSSSNKSNKNLAQSSFLSSSLSSSSLGTCDPYFASFLSQSNPHYYSNSILSTDYALTNSNSIGLDNNLNDSNSHLDSISYQTKSRIGYTNLKPVNAVLLDEHFDNLLFSYQNKSQNNSSFSTVGSNPESNDDLLFNAYNINNEQNFPSFETHISSNVCNNNSSPNSITPSNDNNMDFLRHKNTRRCKSKGENEFTSEINEIGTVSTTSGGRSISNSTCDSMSVSEASEDVTVKSGRGRRTKSLYDDKGIKISGVWYDASRHLWRAVYLKGDKRKTKGFSILKLADEELENLLFDFGLELDGVEINEDNSKTYKIDVPANRHDLLSVEGLSKALLVFQEKISTPKIELISGVEDYVIYVNPEHLAVRPHVLGAVLKGVKFTAESYASFINFQEKLHHNICRQRSLVAIGTHDLDTITPPFTYSGELATSVEFVPLTETTKSFRADKLLESYESHKQLKAYVPLLKGQSHYPFVKDSKGVICSMPPIINSNHSKITLDTKNVFIDVTCTDRHKGEIVLKQIVAAFSVYTTPKYRVHQVLICDGRDKKPLKQCSFEETELVITCDYLRRVSGLHLEASDYCKLLKKMMLCCQPHGDSIKVVVPINRLDIHSCCDVAEDVCIAYGYNNIRKMTYSSGAHTEKSLQKTRLRKLLSLAKYQEVLMPILSSKSVEEGISKAEKVTLLNSNVPGIDIARTTLIPGILKALNSAKRYPLPIRIFEIGEVCLKSEDSDVGAINSTRISAAITDSHTAGFEEIQGVLELVMNQMGYGSRYQFDEFKMLKKQVPYNLKKVYDLKEAPNPFFLDKRSVRIVTIQSESEQELGVMGVVHPDYLRKFDLGTPVSLFEIGIPAPN